MDNDSGTNGNTAKQGEVKLERVLGLTVSSTTALDCDPNSSTVAYPAGCAVVLYNVRRNKQTHIISSSKKTITSLAFSEDGRYLVTGECGHPSYVRVWDVQDQIQVAEMSGHKYGINCVAFSPNMKYVVSVGSQHDMTVNVWDWKGKTKIASNKVSCKVKAIAFSCEGSYFVTVGNNHVKFWYLEQSRIAKHKLETVPLMGRSAILGDQRNNYFCDVACGRGENLESTYAITKSGILCEFNGRRLLDKWVELRTSSANSIRVGESHIVVGCSDGVVRCFSPYNLRFICTLPKPHYLGVDVAKGISGKFPSIQGSSTKYPDAVAATLDEVHKKVTCIYSDHSMYVWDIKDTKKVGKTHSFLYHGACIWGIEHYPEVTGGALPSGTFLTCSSDDTIRVWNFDANLSHGCSYQRNIYSFALLKIFYTDPDFTFLCDADINPSGSNDKVDTVYDGKNGVRCLRVSPDGNHLASGDRSGNIRIYDIKCAEMMCKIEAHDSEVLCLEYSRSVSGKGKYLASASRDRLIHIFDVEQDYAFLQTLDDHSSSVTAVRFVHSSKQLQLISCGADKSVIFRRAQFTPRLKFVRDHHMVGKTTFYDMDVDAQQRHIVTACQDQNIRSYSVSSTKLSRSFRGSLGEEGTLIKVVLDPSGTYLATSSTDKTVSIFDYYTGECISVVTGHSELVTSLVFSNNGKYIISVCGDGCVFMWRLPIGVTQNIVAKQAILDSPFSGLIQEGKKTAVAEPIQMAERDGLKKNSSFSSPIWDTQTKEENENSLEYRFSVGQLPGWAKKQMVEDSTTSSSYSESESLNSLQPRGRWAQRVDGQGLVVRSYLPSDSVIPYPSNQGPKQSKQPSAEVRHFQSTTEEMIGESKQISTAQITLHQDGNSLARSKSESARIRHFTDSSTASSVRLEDEDERSDSAATESEVPYPPSEDGSEFGNSSFSVQASKNESLKSIRRRLRRSKTENLHEIPLIRHSEQEVNSDGDDSGTVLEGEKSFVSSMYVSTENLERLDEREKFMKRTYESLDRSTSAVWHNRSLEEQGYDERKSISAKYLSTSTHNSSLTHTPGNGKQIHTQTKKREELTKALNDARKKLETLGWRKGLSTSKSVGDLRSVPDKDSLWKNISSEAEDGDIRRTSSFGDIASSFSTHSRPSHNTFDSDSVSAPLWARAKQFDDTKPAKPIASVTSTPSKSFISRSASISSLHQSEKLESLNNFQKTNPSNSPVRIVQSPYKHITSSHLMRSSSSSAMNVIGRSSIAAVPPRQLTLTSTHGRWQHSDSSSSDASPTDFKPSTLTAKNLVAHWEKKLGNSDSSNKDICGKYEYNKASRSKSDWDLRKAGRQNIEPKRTDCKLNAPLYNSQETLGRQLLDEDNDNEKRFSSKSKGLEISPNDLPVKDMNPAAKSFLHYNSSSVPLTKELCEQLAEELKRVTMTAMQVFQRVTLDTELTPMEKSTMTTALAQGVWQAQQNLRPAMPPVPMWPASSSSSLDSNIFLQNKGIGNINSPMSIDSTIHKGMCDNPDALNAMTLLQQYSDKLLNLVEQHINKNTSETSNK